MHVIANKSMRQATLKWCFVFLVILKLYKLYRNIFFSCGAYFEVNKYNSFYNKKGCDVKQHIPLLVKKLDNRYRSKQRPNNIFLKYDLFISNIFNIKLKFPQYSHFIGNISNIMANFYQYWYYIGKNGILAQFSPILICHQGKMVKNASNNRLIASINFLIQLIDLINKCICLKLRDLHVNLSWLNTWQH